MPNLNDYKNNISDQIGSDRKFPDWDILPPFEFINPRKRKIEPRPEAKENESLNSVNESETFSKNTKILFENGSNQQSKESHQECPVCGTLNPSKSQFCIDCGTQLNYETLEEQQKSLKNILCPNCDEKIDSITDMTNNWAYKCPNCGLIFNISQKSK